MVGACQIRVLSARAALFTAYRADKFISLNGFALEALIELPAAFGICLEMPIVSRVAEKFLQVGRECIGAASIFPCANSLENSIFLRTALHSVLVRYHRSSDIGSPVSHMHRLAAHKPHWHQKNHRMALGIALIRHKAADLRIIFACK